MEIETLFYNNLFLLVNLYPLSGGIIVAIIVTIILLFASALISGSEVAFFSLDPSDVEKMEESDTKSYNKAASLLKRPEELLATILIANNFVNVGIVILSAYVAEALVDFGRGDVIQFVFEVVIITGMLLLFGEILPKVYAGRFPRRFSSFMAFPLAFLTGFFRPLSAILVKSTDVVNRRLAKRMKRISMDDISDALDLADDEHTEGKDILKGIATFGSINVEEVMTARVDVVDLDIKSELSKVISVIVESGYSRIPVYDEGPDDVKGILYVKDLLPYLSEKNSFNWSSLLRPPYYVPETKRINDLLQEFKEQKIHMAVVVDEYGGTSGIVTLEDILEEIVGDITDEMDDEELNFSVQADGTYIFEGKTLLKDFYKITSLPEDTFDKIVGDAESLAGLLLEIKGLIPEKHEIIDYGSLRFVILAADSRRIKKVKFINKMKIK
ncbi:gliding motility-associated protein GldE [Marinilabiliaceae bacterium ANBcel2]|nr:gliding motility-associated protein GldE [Marinilabiliaceae bacterium ANBcel2]